MLPAASNARAGHRFRDPALGELARFALTGLAAYGADVLVFNAALVAAHLGALEAKLISSAVAIVVAFLGSRYYTWSDRAPARPGRAMLEFVGISVLAALVQVGCLFLSHHLLGFTSVLADNVSANVIGMGLATAFRFWAFRRFVFVPEGSLRTTGRPLRRFSGRR